MLSLSDFQSNPNNHRIPVCEVDGRVYYAKPGQEQEVHVYTNAVSNHPTVNVNRDTHAAHVAPNSELFLPSDHSLTQRLQSAWYENGYKEVLRVLSESDEYKAAQLLASGLLDSLELFRNFTNNLNIFREKESIVESDFLPQHRGPVERLVWHPHHTKLAVLTKDDSITIYSKQTPLTPILKGRSQRSITCLAWRPLCSSELAVGCSEGVLVWQLEPKSVIARPSINCAVRLQAPGHVDITTLAWNPHNGRLLVSGNRHENTLWVWHVDMREHVSLKRSGGKGTSHLCWSQDGATLLAASYSNLFRVWKCGGQEWVCEAWRGLGCSVGAAVFCPSSSRLLIACRTEPILYTLESSHDQTVFQHNKEKPVALPVADFTRVELDSGICVGGQVEEMSWDDKGKFLAVTFRDCRVVALFQTLFQPHFHLTPKYFIEGSEEEEPSSIAFENEFTEGANLTIAWSSGRVQYYPIIFEREEPTHCVVGLRRLSGRPALPPVANRSHDMSSHFYSFTSPTSPNASLL